MHELLSRNPVAGLVVLAIRFKELPNATLISNLASGAQVYRSRALSF